MSSICKNCGKENPKSFTYCPNCSQKTIIHRLTFHDILHEAIHYFTHADKGIFQLIRDLVIKRGIVAKEYINGKRKKYFPPLNFFLLIATIFVFMSTINNADNKNTFVKQHPEVAEIKDPVQKQHQIAVYQRMDNVLAFTTKYSNLMAMCSLPLSALIFWLFYRKNKYNYLEHVVANMYMIGICILCYALLILPVSYLFRVPSNYAVIGFFTLQLIYFPVFYHGFLNKKDKASFFKIFGVTIISLLVWIFLSSTVIKIYISNGFWGVLS